MNVEFCRSEWHQAGFSLLELVVAMAIFSIALALAMPALRKPNDFAELRADAANMAAKFRLLRSQAMTSNRATSMTFDSKTRTYIYDPTGQSTELRRDVGLAVVVPDPNPGEPGKSKVIYFPDGSATGGQLKFSSAGGSCTIEIIALTGAVAFDGCRR